jgi:hypothetical protein
LDIDRLGQTVQGHFKEQLSEIQARRKRQSAPKLERTHQHITDNQFADQLLRQIAVRLPD